MKKAVMYGAGNIGRGFIGKLFSESGYEVCFVDVASDIVDKLNDDRCYPVRIVDNDFSKEQIVENVRAVNGADISSVAEEIAQADIMATAVGVNVLPKIVKPICVGLKKRFEQNSSALNIIICENLIDADKYLRELIEKELGSDYKKMLDEKLGLVEASIGRMVPVMTDAMKEGNILRVWVEPYQTLPVDKDAFLGDVPELTGLVPFSPFGFYIKRKLFIHNMAHAMHAYLGWRKGYSYIYQCTADDGIREVVKAAMRESAVALHTEYGVPQKEIEDHIDDLIYRFGNKALLDTVDRVGRDPLRKLKSNDRLIGAALYCKSQGVEPVNILKGIVAGLAYANESDESALKMQDVIKHKGIEEFLKQYCGLSQQSALFKNIVEQYENAKEV